MTFDKNDVEKNRGVAVLGYLPVLFLIPLFGAKESKFAQWHAKQGLALSVFGFAIGVFDVVLLVVPIIGWLMMLVLPILYVVWMIVAMMRAWRGKDWQMPFIGQYFADLRF